ncbi:MAG TPA: thioredoxin domain-containing protein [Anaeromyxobacteraceae bacterium]|nr:thioredoxin domain-containing protein [Anaeromyxobacteraceae bacterium]
MGILSALFGPAKPKVQPTHVDDVNFHAEVLRSELPVVVDVWSPGCSPCRMLEPIIMDLAGEYAGRVKVVELNAAEAGRTAARHGVMGTPTVLFFRKGREVERVVGFTGKQYLREVVDVALLGGAPVKG